jgi:hypothetical protein
MPRADYRYCKACGRSSQEVGPLSWARLCEECGGERLEENVYGIASKSGPAFERQRVGMIAQALGVTKVMAHQLLRAANGAPLDEVVDSEP